MPLVEGDELHPKANIDKMANGEALTDEDREPWLELVRKSAEHVVAEQQVAKEGKSPGNGDAPAGVVVSCSSLRKYYREILRGHKKPATDKKLTPGHLEPPDAGDLPTYFVYIQGSRETLEERMGKRQGHYMKGNMLDSQLRTLESPEGEEGVVVVQLDDSTDKQTRDALEGLHKLWA